MLLNKFSSVSFFHWQNIYKFRIKRAKQLSKILKRLVRRRLKEVYPRLAILVTNKHFYKKFIIERETFLFNLDDHNFMLKDKTVSKAFEDFTGENYQEDGSSLVVSNTQRNKGTMF